MCCLTRSPCSEARAPIEPRRDRPYRRTPHGAGRRACPGRPHNDVPQSVGWLRHRRWSRRGRGRRGDGASGRAPRGGRCPRAGRRTSPRGHCLRDARALRSPGPDATVHGRSHPRRCRQGPLPRSAIRTNAWRVQGSGHSTRQASRCPRACLPLPWKTSSALTLSTGRPAGPTSFSSLPRLSTGARRHRMVPAGG